VLDNNESVGCGCGSGCCGAPQEAEIEKKRIIIDFLYLDVSICVRCQGTDTSLDQAFSEVSTILKATGVEVVVNKINVITEELAKKYKFVSSPTIRVNVMIFKWKLRKVYANLAAIYAAKKLIAGFGCTKGTNIRFRLKQ